MTAAELIRILAMLPQNTVVNAMGQEDYEAATFDSIEVSMSGKEVMILGVSEGDSFDLRQPVPNRRYRNQYPDSINKSNPQWPNIHNYGGNAKQVIPLGPASR